ncbi:hypothetical protein RO3G_10346 [Lichtheimia corymbifera JMRC:FSU:9682]|uniref:Methyltransferase FkbM domain-containing protein n=1 Tax=Lichtheimia corymbifera JMRC:FSU:9682 TaxID=1263082 RepID=A0A068RY88_9FUNG|nr:hypothetical protein RO3G_10346 [Lichtheimia corymbifera JMRC:FSU:9682]
MMMKTRKWSKMWFFGLIASFFICNLIFWRYRPRGGCDQSGNCTFFGKKFGSAPKPQPSTPPAPPPPAEAKLNPVLVQEIQPIKRPNTFIPAGRPAEAQDLELIAPTSDDITIRLKKDAALGYASRTEPWQFGLVNTKPDVFIASEGHFAFVNQHYEREFRIYSLMKWILRVYRRDPQRTQPLLMVDAGSNHGLFSMVAAASGARVIAFEPQINLRSVIAFGGRLNQLSDRIRVLPFGVLDQFRKIAMAKYEVKDGGIGHLDLAGGANSTMLTQTIRLDNLPRYDMLFGGDKNHSEKSLINQPEEIDPAYAAALRSLNTLGVRSSMDEALTLKNPIHFLKIDVEGFELNALDSATRLFEAGLVEHAVLEFGPPNRWDVTVPKEEQLNTTQIRRRTIDHAKKVLHRVTKEWDMDIYLLPAMGWQSTVKYMLLRNVTFNNMPTGNQVVHKLKAWDFDHQPFEQDEFERELDVCSPLVKCTCGSLSVPAIQQ